MYININLDNFFNEIKDGKKWNVQWNYFFDYIEKIENEPGAIEYIDSFYRENKKNVIKYIIGRGVFDNSSEQQIEEIEKGIDEILLQSNGGFGKFRQIIIENPHIILEKLKVTYGYNIAQQFLEKERLNKFLKENYVEIWNKLDKEIKSDQGISMAMNLVKTCFSLNNLDFLYENLEEIVQNTNEAEAEIIFNEYFKLLEQDTKKGETIKESIKPIINRFYEAYKEKFAESMINIVIKGKKIKNVEKYANTFANLLDGLMKEQNCEISDIRKIGSGFYSSVFSIGEKILKIGNPRRTYDIPNHRRILQPFIRENFEDGENKPFLCVEIAEAVIPLEMQNMNSIYEIYKELRLDGIVWGDAKYENLGMLKGKNLPKYKGEHFEGNPEFVGLKGKVNTESVLDERRVCNSRFRLYL